MDTWTIFGLFFFLMILMAYLLIFIFQYRNYIHGTERLIILNTRTASFLPFYAFFILISLIKPEALAALSILISMMESYSFYCFFTMIITNLHGPENAIAVFKNTGKQLLCCQAICPSDHNAFYQKILKALFHFLVTRNVIITIAAVGFYTKSLAGKAVYAIGNGIGTVVLFYALFHIILFYENVFHECMNLFGIVKFALLKFSVGLIVLQGLIVEFMAQANSEPYNDDTHWTAEQKTQRGYCVLILMEFFILALPYSYAFLQPIALPSNKSLFEPVVSTKPPLTFSSYTSQVFKFWDVFGSLNFGKREFLTQNLTPED